MGFSPEAKRMIQGCPSSTSGHSSQHHITSSHVLQPEILLTIS
jgi:hypothetical protein